MLLKLTCTTYYNNLRNWEELNNIQYFIGYNNVTRSELLKNTKYVSV